MAVAAMKAFQQAQLGVTDAQTLPVALGGEELRLGGEREKARRRFRENRAQRDESDAN
jgi:hypothetical protein